MLMQLIFKKPCYSCDRCFRISKVEFKKIPDKQSKLEIPQVLGRATKKVIKLT